MPIDIIEGKFHASYNSYEKFKKEYELGNFTGYVLLSAKLKKGYEYGHIFYDSGKETGYYWVCGNEESFGEDALKYIKSLKEIGTVYVYCYDKNKLDIMKELYGEIFVNIVSTPSAISNNHNVEKTMMEEELSRDELLKKLGIKAPTEEDIQTIVDNAFTWEDCRELDTLKEEVCEKLELYISGQENISEFKIETSVKYTEDGKYLCDYIVKIKPKKIYGLICKSINIDHIKKGMHKIITNAKSPNYYLYTTSQNGIGGKSTCTVVQSCVYVRKY